MVCPTGPLALPSVKKFNPVPITFCVSPAIPSIIEGLPIDCGIATDLSKDKFLRTLKLSVVILGEPTFLYVSEIDFTN